MAGVRILLPVQYACRRIFNKITEAYENEEMNQKAELTIFGYEMRSEFVHTPAALFIAMLYQHIYIRTQ